MMAHSPCSFSAVREPTPATLEAAQRILARCDELAALSDDADGIRRVFLSPQHRDANACVGRWMRQAGMTVWEDAVGSVWGRCAAAEATAPAVVVGSHLDTVPDAGRYDGTLGVLLGIAAVEALQGTGERLPFHVDVVGFGEEEGVRFGATLMSSRAFAGNWQPEWLALRDADDVSLRAAMSAFGLVPAEAAQASRAHAPPLAYLEVHIEQGPVLEARGLPLGVVRAIAGCRRFNVNVAGAASHAGTTPMNLRRDALAGAAEAVSLLESLARREGLVATVGQLRCLPGAANVIPATVEFSVDARAGEDGRRDALVDAFAAGLKRLSAERQLESTMRETHSAAAAQCAAWLQSTLAEAVSEQDIPPLHLDSGAGHDAMAVAGLCDVGMLFVRCAGGVSHHPDESVTVEDVACALAALQSALKRIVRRPA